jgi:hypothetical protein
MMPEPHLFRPRRQEPWLCSLTSVPPLTVALPNSLFLPSLREQSNASTNVRDLGWANLAPDTSFLRVIRMKRLCFQLKEHQSSFCPQWRARQRSTAATPALSTRAWKPLYIQPVVASKQLIAALLL